MELVILGFLFCFLGLLSLLDPITTIHDALPFFALGLGLIVAGVVAVFLDYKDRLDKHTTPISV